MVKKRWAANCLTLEDAYPECVRLRNEWETKYRDAEAQVKGLLVDRDRLEQVLTDETKRKLALVQSLDYWRNRAEDQFSFLELAGIGTVALVVGVAVGAGACLVWCP